MLNNEWNSGYELVNWEEATVPEGAVEQIINLDQGIVHGVYRGDVPSFVVNRNSNVGIGTDTPTAKLDVNGNTRINGELNVNSIKIGNYEMKIVNNQLVFTQGNVEKFRL